MPSPDSRKFLTFIQVGKSTIERKKPFPRRFRAIKRPSNRLKSLYGAIELLQRIEADIPQLFTYIKKFLKP
jgi:hypothetical protein